MKTLTEYFNQLSEGAVTRRGNTIEVGSLKLQLYPDHIFYVINGGKEADLSIYKDGAFKTSRSNEIYLKDAAKHGVPNVFIELFAKFFSIRDNEEATQFVANSLENLYKTHAKESSIGEVDAMKKLKITTEVDLNETEGLYNTTDDRWSRRAKHQMSKNELQSAADYSEFSKGDIAIYEGREVEVRIPIGPSGTAGIMLEGHLKMVKRSSLNSLDESMGVMGGMKPLGPLNRIMQLAGLEHSGAVIEDESAMEEEVIEEEVIEEANVSSMFNNLYNFNLNNPSYKNNPAAARVATVGQVLAGMQSMIDGLPKDLPADVERQLSMVPGVGANLIKAATGMTKPAPGAPGIAK